MPLQRRVPKRGFHNRFRKIYQIVNVRDLTRFPADAGVDENSLREVGLINKKGIPVKLLGDGTIDRALKISVHACTKRAKELVEKAGGEIQIVKK
jgi:large subunit ribosomal protein L15